MKRRRYRSDERQGDERHYAFRHVPLLIESRRGEEDVQL